MGSHLLSDTAVQAFVESVAAAGAVGIGFGCGNYHASAPEAMVRECEHKGIPLVEVPFDVPFLAIIEEIAEAERRRHSERQRRALKREVLFLERWSSGEGLPALARALAAETGHGVVILTAGGYIEAVTEAAEGAAEQIALHVQNLRGQGRRSSISVGSCQAELIPLTRRDVTVGWLAVALRGAIDDGLLEPLHEAAPFISMALTSHIDQGEQERALVGRLFKLIEDGTADPVVVADRLTAVGIATDNLLATAWPADDGPSIPRDLGPTLAGDQTEKRIVLIGHSEAANSHLLRIRRPIGIGSPVKLEFLARTIREAKAARAVAIAADRPITWRDLAEIPPLLQRIPPDELEPFVRQLVLPLVEYDARRDAGLIATLRAYLASEGRILDVADSLAVHPNSVRHRLRTIRSLTGRNPQKFVPRCAFYLAMTAWDLSHHSRSREVTGGG